LRVSGHFLMSFRESRLLRYFGHESEVNIGSDIEGIAPGCFSGCESVVRVRFASDCRLRVLDSAAFAGCSSLQSICIAPSIERIDGDCFQICEYG
jgi:hypothetical protein